MKTYNFKVVSFQPSTDTQWANINDLVEKTYTTSRPRKTNLRNVVDGIRHLVRTGCQWRNVDTRYEKMSVLRYYFDLWTKTILGLRYSKGFFRPQSAIRLRGRTKFRCY